MAIINFFPADQRGHTRLNWLDSRHSFSFGNWFHPERRGFGLLRVLNDDVLAPGAGFDSHPHDNMEIISIPLEGSLQHRDSMGNHDIISTGEIQAMSSGTGIFHSEYNASNLSTVRFLQIWILPRRRNLPPLYQKVSIDYEQLENNFTEIAGPEEKPGCLQIRQHARLFLGKFQKGIWDVPIPVEKNSGTFVFLIQGKIRIFDNELSDRDAIGIQECTSMEVKVLNPSFILLMQVPMQHQPIQ